MLLSEILEIADVLDQPVKPGTNLEKLFNRYNFKIIRKEIKSKKGSTEFLKIIIPGRNGKMSGGKMPTLGIIGRLGGVGARPEIIGLVSDADGALTVLSTALKLVKMYNNGDIFQGDIIISTNVCTNAPTLFRKPVPFMDSPVSVETMNKYEVDSRMDAILSIDTTRGNKVINQTGYAISPTIKEGYILRVSEDLLSIMEQTTGKLPITFPITIQDITPYGNDIYHLNSIMQPATVTNSPVVGVAITSEIPVAGCATGITNAFQIDSVGRFIIETAQRYGSNNCTFYDQNEYLKLIKYYGNLKRFQKFK